MTFWTRPFTLAAHNPPALHRFPFLINTDVGIFFTTPTPPLPPRSTDQQLQLDPQIHFNVHPGDGTATVANPKNAMPADQRPSTSAGLSSVVHASWDHSIGMDQRPSTSSGISYAQNPSMRIDLPPVDLSITPSGAPLHPLPSGIRSNSFTNVNPNGHGNGEKSNVRFYQFEPHRTPTADRPDFMTGYESSTVNASNPARIPSTSHHRFSDSSASASAALAQHFQAEYQQQLRPASSSGAELQSSYHYQQQHPHHHPYSLQPQTILPAPQQTRTHPHLAPSQTSPSPQFQYNLLPPSNTSTFFSDIPSPPSSMSSVASSGRFPSPPSQAPTTGLPNPFETFDRLNVDSAPSSEAGSRPTSAVVDLDWERAYALDRGVYIPHSQHHPHHGGLGDEAVLRRNSDGQKDHPAVVWSYSPRDDFPGC
ncbi:hypothetical protein BT69DRAFT_619907 [Atractiella rhizophila]|nr:hypothetical protein BT69DRAFT_619907 [Atractiella rhizophila]